MPNNGRITECPFYVNERNGYITCEDAKRRFADSQTKEDHMDTYCDDKWEECSYAAAMLEAYKEGESSVVTNKIKALESENRKVNIMLTKAENREAVKDREIKKLVMRNDSLGKRYGKLKQLHERLEQTQQLAMEQIQSAMDICEARVAYLLSERPDGKLDEVKFREWHKEHEYCIVPEGEATDDEFKITGWVLRARKAGEADGTEGLTREPETAGRREAKGAECSEEAEKEK